MKFVVNPPSITTIRLGRPDQSSSVPKATEAFPIGSPAVRPKLKQALITPENVATSSPFLKSNSLIVFNFSSEGISFSLFAPASAATQIPIKQTATPRSVILPGFVAAICPMVSPTGMSGMKVLRIGGKSVPKAAQYPSATPIPSDMPR